MAKTKIEAILLSRDPDLADVLDEVLKPLSVRVVRNAPSLQNGLVPPIPPKIDKGPPLLIVDGRDYLGACLPLEEGQSLSAEVSSPVEVGGLESVTLLLLNSKDADALPGSIKAGEVMCFPLQPEEVRLRTRRLLDPPLFASPGRVAAFTAKSSLKALSGLHLDEDRYEIALDGESLSLTFREYELLKYLMIHPGRTFTREHLLSRVWGQDYLGGTRTVDVHIRRLRMKVEGDGREFIKTVRSVGYRFVG